MDAMKEQRRQELYRLLGDLPSTSHKITAKKCSEEEQPSYILEKLLLDLNGIEPVPAYFVKPKNVQGRTPVVLFNHSHGRNFELGKDELLKGNTYLQNPSYAEQLTKMGYSALCIDAWGFGERRGRTESEIFKQMLWMGQVLWGMRVYDSMRALDYLVSRPDVDAEQMATLGISMGGTMAWWTAALDTRIKACVNICSLTDFEALIDTQGLDGHSIYFYVPGLLKHFSTSQINELISPRPHLALAGNYDRLTPAQGLDKIDRALKSKYTEEGASEAWTMRRYNTGHFETADMRFEIVNFLKRWL